MMEVQGEYSEQAVAGTGTGYVCITCMYLLLISEIE